MEKPRSAAERIRHEGDGKEALCLFLLCWLSYAMNYICRKNYSVCMAAMMGEGLFDKAFAGTILTGFFMSYALGQMICGLIGDKIHPRILVSGGLLGAGLMNALMPLCSAPWLFLAVWCANGLCCAMLFAPIIRLFAECLTKDEQLRYGTIMTAAIPGGQWIAYMLASLVLGHLGWRDVFYISGITNILMGVGFFLGLWGLRGFVSHRRALLMADGEAHPEGSEPEEQDRPNAPASCPKLPKSMLLSTGFAFAAMGILCNGILKDGVTDWMPTFLSDHFSLSSASISLMMTVLPVFNLAGVLVSQRLLRKTRNEYTASVPLFGISLLATTALLCFGRRSPVMAAVCAALCTSTMLGVNNLLLTFVPLNYSVVGKAAFATGLLDAFSYLATAISGFVIGQFTAIAGWGLVLGGWILVAILGLVNVITAIRPWNRGRSLLRLYHHHLLEHSPK